MTLKVQETHEKRLNLTKIKPLCTKGHYEQSEEATHGMGENICKSHLGKGLLSRIYKEYL